MTSPSPAPSAARRDAILIIDDQEENLRVVGTVLSIMGYEVVPAKSGDQAFKRLEAAKPDLILLDLFMPDQDGLDVCRRLKADPRWADIPIIFLSAADDKNMIVGALEAGGVDYVTKPFNKAELLSRVRTHLALKGARDQLQNVAADKDELMGILTHDLRNHLAGMRLSAGLLSERSGEMPARCSALVENIVQSTDRMLVFLKEFLANQGAEQLMLAPAPLDLAVAVRDAAGRHRPAAEAKSIQLECAVPDEAVPVLADRAALEQVLDNLVTNALKFTPASGTVTLTAEALPEGGGRCEVRDSGPGFSEEDRAKMFQRYGRLSARPTAGEPSTGLGLSIVQRLAGSMKGRVQLLSAPGEGARLAVQLPAAPVPESVAALA